jgi:hypothetical protein
VNHIFLSLGIIFSLGQGNLEAGTPPYTQMLAISFDAPALRAYISNGSGQRSGADPSVAMDAVGQQEINGADYQLNEIPGSSCGQSNLDEGQASTLWEIDLTNSTGIYFLNYTSNLTQSADVVSIDIQYYSPDKFLPFRAALMAQSGTYKKLQIAVSAEGTTITPIINTDDFLHDSQSACKLLDIAPEAARDVLEELAAAVEKAIAKGDTDKERIDLELYVRILNRLHNWANKGTRQDWDDLKDHANCDELRKDKDDTKFFAKDPSYSALKLDAETLLNSLKQATNGNKSGDHDAHGDNH